MEKFQPYGIFSPTSEDDLVFSLCAAEGKLTNRFRDIDAKYKKRK